MKAMFRPKGLLTILFSILLIFAIYKTFHPKEKTYIALGDFYAKGHTQENAYDYGYKDYVKNNLEKAKELRHFEDAYVKNEYTIKGLYEDIKNNDFLIHNSNLISIKKELREADYITITIGLNDIFDALKIRNIEELETVDKKDFQKVVKKSIKDYDLLLTEIKKYAKGNIVIVPYNIYRNAYYPKVYQYLNKWNQEVEKLAKKKKVKSICNFQTFSKENLYPTYKTYKRQAYRVYKVLKS